jgi:hypothetical protein
LTRSGSHFRQLETTRSYGASFSLFQPRFHDSPLGTVIHPHSEVWSVHFDCDLFCRSQLSSLLLVCMRRQLSFDVRAFLHKLIWFLRTLSESIFGISLAVGRRRRFAPPLPTALQVTGPMNFQKLIRSSQTVAFTAIPNRGSS